MAGVPNPNVLGDTVGSAMAMMQQQKQLQLLDRQNFTEQQRGFGQLIDNIKTQVNDLRFMVGGTGAPDVPGITGVRWRLQNALTSASVNSAQAAANYAQAGVGQREAFSSVGGVLRPLTDFAGEGTRGLVSWLRGVGGSSARSLLPPSSSVNNWSPRGTGRSF